jgi:hypothetical protein
MTKINGAIIYRGPSMLDGAPIIVVVTGLAKSSRNEKTGDMLQTWIIRDDINPIEAAKTGQDESICGDCIHRPLLGGSCYVQLAHAPLNIFKSSHRGIYPTITGLSDIAALGVDRIVRLGSYGDPAAVPVGVWEALTAHASAWTGYTHQWRNAPHLMALCMASADSAAEAIMAKAMGWRTFRVRTATEAVMDKEFICPASKEAGYKTDCASCKACMGTSAKAKASPVIIAHGAKSRRFELTRSPSKIAA